MTRSRRNIQGAHFLPPARWRHRSCSALASLTSFPRVPILRNSISRIQSLCDNRSQNCFPLGMPSQIRQNNWAMHDSFTCSSTYNIRPRTACGNNKCTAPHSTAQHRTTNTTAHRAPEHAKHQTRSVSDRLWALQTPSTRYRHIFAISPKFNWRLFFPEHIILYIYLETE